MWPMSKCTIISTTHKMAKRLYYIKDKIDVKHNDEQNVLLHKG